MKKLLAMTLIAGLSVGLVGCSNGETDGKKEDLVITIATHHECGDNPYSEE